MPFEAEYPESHGDRRAPSPLTGKRVLIWLCALFGVMLCANLVLTWFALRTLPGGTLANSWDVSQNYNSRIAEARAQSARGWSAQIDLRPEVGGARVSFAPVDQGGEFVTGLTVEALFEHPSDRRADQRIVLQLQGRAYQGKIAGLKAGGWTLQIAAHRAGERLYMTRNQVALQ